MNAHKCAQELYMSECLSPYKTRVIFYNINLNPSSGVITPNQRGFYCFDELNVWGYKTHFLLCKYIYINFISNFTRPQQLGSYLRDNTTSWTSIAETATAQWEWASFFILYDVSYLNVPTSLVTNNKSIHGWWYSQHRLFGGRQQPPANVLYFILRL